MFIWSSYYNIRRHDILFFISERPTKTEIVCPNPQWNSHIIPTRVLSNHHFITWFCEVLLSCGEVGLGKKAVIVIDLVEESAEKSNEEIERDILEELSAKPTIPWVRSVEKVTVIEDS